MVGVDDRGNCGWCTWWRMVEVGADRRGQCCGKNIFDSDSIISEKATPTPPKKHATPPTPYHWSTNANLVLMLA